MRDQQPLAPIVAHPAARRLRRRDLLRFTAFGAGSVTLAGVLAACGGTATANTAPVASASTAPSAAPSVAPSTVPASAAGAASAAPASTATRPAAPSAAAIVTSGTASTPTVAGTPVAATPTASGTISYFITGDPAEKVAYESMVTAFTQRQTRIKIDLSHVPSAGDYTKRLTADLAAGTPADVIMLNYRRFGAFAARGAFDPLGPYLAAGGAIKQADLHAELIPAFSRNGVLVGMPQNASSLVGYYNKNLFDKAGIAYPKAGWTWDDFIKTAQGLTKGTEQYGLGMDPQMIRVAPFIWQNGGDIVDNIQKPTKLTFDRSESVAAVQWFVDLQVKYKVAPDAVQVAAEDDEKRFLNGRSAIFFDSRRFVPTMREIKEFDWDVAPLPTGKSRASILHSDAYFLTAASKNKAAAYAFIEFANGQEGQGIIARTGRTVPSLKSVAESSAFLDGVSKPLSNRVFLDAIPILRPTISIDTTEQIESLVNNELKRAFYGQATVAEAIATMTTRTAELFK